MKMRRVDPTAPPVKARYNKRTQDNIQQKKRGKNPRKESKGSNYEADEESSTQINWFKEMPLCEDIKIVELEKLAESDMREFGDKCLREINELKFQKICERTQAYMNSKCSEGELFQDFQKVFGNRDAFEFFAYYIKTVQDPDIYYDLEQELIYRCNKLRTENINILSNNQKFTDFFSKIEAGLAENIFQRFKAGTLSMDSPCIKNQMVLFQYFGVLKKMFKGEIVKLKNLNRFLESPKSIHLMIDSFFIPKSEIQRHWNKINSSDIILAFLFFHIGGQKLTGMKVRLETAKINPNLNKIFLRHYPEFAKDMGLKIDSEQEDYVMQAKRYVDSDEENEDEEEVDLEEEPKGKNNSHQ